MTLHLQSQSVPPDHKKELEQALSTLRSKVESALALIEQQQDNQDKSMTAAIREIDLQLESLGTLAHVMNADNEELKMVAGKLRTQRNDALKARDQVLAYLRQLKKR